MSGHNRWSQIQRQKNITDKKRGQIFSKLAKMITVAAKDGADPETNSKLKGVIEKVKEFNLPNENIERAIKRAGEKEKAQLETLLVEALGPGGTALKIKAITDNRLRTLAEIKKILNEHESKMVPPDSLSWMFGQPVSIADVSDRKKLDKLLEALDDQDEVEDVSSNLLEDNQ